MQTITRAPATATATKKVRSYLPTGQMGRRLNKIADLQFQIQRLEKELDIHRAKVLDHMIFTKLDKIEFQDITISLRMRHNYTYSVLVSNQMLEIKNSQKFEIKEGVAIDSPTYFINISSKAKITSGVKL